MTDDKRALSGNQRGEILRAFSRRDSEFLDECCRMLDADKEARPSIYSELYENLATRSLSKIAVLDRLLAHFHYHTLSSSPAATSLAQERYDLAYLIDYEQDNPQRFVSMLIDFAAQRSPNIDEALHFEHLLNSGQVDARGLLEEFASRYADTMAIEKGDIVLSPPTVSGHTLCQTWRGRLIIHPNAVIEPTIKAGVMAAMQEHKGAFKSPAGSVLAATFDLTSAEQWRLSYALETSGEHPIELAIQQAYWDGSSDGPLDGVLFRLTSSHSLSGHHDFTLSGAARDVQVSLSCLQGAREAEVTIAPLNIRLEPIL